PPAPRSASARPRRSPRTRPAGVTKVDSESEGATLTYEVTLLRANGVETKVTVDARTGHLLGTVTEQSDAADQSQGAEQSEGTQQQEAQEQPDAKDGSDAPDPAEAKDQPDTVDHPGATR